MDKLIKRKNNGLIKVITGIRRCGKSYLLNNQFYHYLLESRVDPEKFMAYIHSKVVGEGMYYLLLDEIQMLGCFEAVLNGYLRKDNMDVFVTGSNAKTFV